MKRNARFILAILFVLGLVLMSAPRQAQAGEIRSNPNIAGGSWTAGQVVDVTTLAAKAPTWLQLLTSGVKITEAGKICHPFRGGQFGWIGEIRQYKNGEWFKLKTTNDWVPSKEGEFMSCAEAPAAGTYALFGYWIRPAGYVVAPSAACNYSTADWTASFYGEGIYSLQANLDNLPEGTSVSYSFIEPYTGLTGDLYNGNGLLVEGWVTFDEQYLFDGWSSLTVEVSALGCSKIILLISG